MQSQHHLSLRLTRDDRVLLRTGVHSDERDQTHEIDLDRDEFEALFRHMLRLRAKLDLRDARGVIDREIR